MVRCEVGIGLINVESGLKSKKSIFDSDSGDGDLTQSESLNSYQRDQTQSDYEGQDKISQSILDKSNINIENLEIANSNHQTTNTDNENTCSNCQTKKNVAHYALIFFYVVVFLTFLLPLLILFCQFREIWILVKQLLEYGPFFH